jgi:hypothetical protein
VKEPVELDVALTVNGASPEVWLGTVKVTVGITAPTVKLVFAVAAA